MHRTHHQYLDVVGSSEGSAVNRRRFASIDKRLPHLIHKYGLALVMVLAVPVMYYGKRTYEFPT